MCKYFLFRFLHHQYKAQMLRRSQQIQEELEMDRQILENMKIEEDRRNSIENERIKRVKNDVEFMKEVRLNLFLIAMFLLLSFFL